MLRRRILQVSIRRQFERLPAQVTRIPSYLSLRREFSAKPQQSIPQGSGSSRKHPGASLLPKFSIGTVALGAAFIAAYQTGYLDKYLIKESQEIPESTNAATSISDPEDSKVFNEIKQDSAQLGKSIAEPSVYESNASTHGVEESSNVPTPNAGHSAESTESYSAPSKLEVTSINQDTRHENANNIQANDNVGSLSIMPSNSAKDSSVQSEDQFVFKSQVEIPDTKHTPTLEQDDKVSIKSEMNYTTTQPVSIQIEPQDVPHDLISQPSSLIDEYHLNANPSNKKAFEDVSGAYISKDGKLVLDLIQAIHEAEKRQAEIDSRFFNEEKRRMKEKYEKDLKDARVRELMYAEKEALLDKELKKERARAISALKSLEESLEEKHRQEMEEKESEAELNLKKTQELSKAELAAAIASEKASHIDKMAEANLNIDALCMAFYARSQEARQTHSVHKLALGALSLEDALSRGLPIQKEIEALLPYLEWIDKHSLLSLAFSSLPEETLNHGTDTLCQLNQKFDDLKGPIRHFSLIPPGGGGILTHFLAHVASWLKVREEDRSGDGIESVINRVESLLAEEKVVEAAEELEKGVKGTEAAQVVDEWIRRARNRAITHQMLTLLQAYASTISLN